MIIRSHRFNQVGMSLVELSAALVIVGVTILVLWQFAASRSQYQASQQSSTLLDRSQTNLTVYAALHGRLPCPARDLLGQETCDGSMSGYLPYLTLGLPNAAAGHLGYAVPPEIPGLNGGDLFTAMRPVTLQPDDNLVAQSALPLHPASSPNDHVMDLCAALGGQGAGTTSADNAAEGLAYRLTEEDRTLTNNETTASDHLRSRLVSRGQLSGQLHCAALYATAGRAHFNARLTSATMARTLRDVQTQLDISRGNAAWGLTQASADVVYAATAGMAKKTTLLAIAISSYMASEATDPTAFTAMLWLTESMVTGAIHLAFFEFQLSRQTAAFQNAQAAHIAMNMLVAQAQALDTEIARNASLNVSSAFFLAEQSLQPVQRITAPDPVQGRWAYGGEVALAAKKAAALLMLGLSKVFD